MFFGTCGRKHSPFYINISVVLTTSTVYRVMVTSNSHLLLVLFYRKSDRLHCISACSAFPVKNVNCLHSVQKGVAGALLLEALRLVRLHARDPQISSKKVCDVGNLSPLEGLRGGAGSVWTSTCHVAIQNELANTARAVSVCNHRITESLCFKKTLRPLTQTINQILPSLPLNYVPKDHICLSF